jgi:spore coat polysaccharide biosynthesis protein SpsF
MGSSRLPGKVLLSAAGKSLLEIELGRLQQCRKPHALCVATTEGHQDDPIVNLCQRLDIPCFRGSEEDVLSRYYEAARFMHADEVIRITADCPLIDPDIVDAVIGKREKTHADYASNTLKRTFPRGLDTECFSFVSLSAAHHEAKEPWEREHVTPFIYGRPDRFSMASLESGKDESRHRWTVDTQEDFQLVSLILERFADNLLAFRSADVLRLFEEKPEWFTINAHVEQKTVPSNSLRK